MMDAATRPKVAKPKVGDYAKLQPLLPVCMHRRIPSALMPALVHQPRRRTSDSSSPSLSDHRHHHQLECTLCRRLWPDRQTFLAHLREHRDPIAQHNMAVETVVNLQITLHPGGTAKTFDLRLHNQTASTLEIRHLFILTDRCSWIFDFDDDTTTAAVDLPAGQHVTLELAAAYIQPHRTNTVLVQTVRSGSEFTEWHRLHPCCSAFQRSMAKRAVPALPCDPAMLALLQGPAAATRRHMTALRALHQPLGVANYSEFFELASQIERIDKQLEVSSYQTNAPQQFSLPAGGAPQICLKVPDALMPNGEPCKLTLYDTVRFTPCDGQPVAGGSAKRFCVAEICNVTARGLLSVRLLGARTAPNRQYNVSFHIGSYVYDIEVAALRWLAECRVLPLLFPRGADVAGGGVDARPVSNDHATAHVDRTAFEWFQADLNERQQLAVRHIVHGTAYPAPYLLFGPPGTGKTKTLCEAVLQLWRCEPDSRLLVCASSNAAADELALRLSQMLPHGCRFGHNLFRLYARSCAQRPVSEDMRRLEAISNGPEFHCPAWSFLRRFRILVCTLVVAGGLRYGVGVDADDFTHVIVDESGSSTELATLLPIALCTTADRIHAHLVLAGDPKQLGPVIKSGHAERLGYGVSLLERLMRLPVYSRRPHPNGPTYNRNVLTKLVNNYRSHPLIMSLSNQAFYAGELCACAPAARIDRFVDWSRLPAAGVPIIFHSVSGLAQRDLGSPSLHNPVELNIVVGYVQQLLQGGGSGGTAGGRLPPVGQHDIGIISPYALQCQKIRLALADRGWPDILVAPVETFQGRERPIILTSTVRSRRTVAGIGFLGSAKRLNVMLTRAQALLIMVGDPQTLQLDRHWRRVLRRFQELGVCVGEEFQVPREEPWSRHHQQQPGAWYRPNYYRHSTHHQPAGLDSDSSAASTSSTGSGVNKPAIATVEDIDAAPEELAAADILAAESDADEDAEEIEQYLRARNYAQKTSMRIKAHARVVHDTDRGTGENRAPSVACAKENRSFGAETSRSSSLSQADSAIGSMPRSHNTSAAQLSPSLCDDDVDYEVEEDDGSDVDDDDGDESPISCDSASETASAIGSDDDDDDDAATTTNIYSKATPNAEPKGRTACVVCKQPYWRPTSPTSPSQFFGGDLSVVFPRADNEPDGQPLVMHCPKIPHYIDLLSAQLYTEPKALPSAAAAQRRSAAKSAKKAPRPTTGSSGWLKDDADVKQWMELCEQIDQLKVKANVGE